MMPRRQRAKWISLVLPPKEMETNAKCGRACLPACKNSHASIWEQGVKKIAGDAVCSLPWLGLYLFILTR